MLDSRELNVSTESRFIRGLVFRDATVGPVPYSGTKSDPVWIPRGSVTRRDGKSVQAERDKSDLTDFLLRVSILGLSWRLSRHAEAERTMSAWDAEMYLPYDGDFLSNLWFSTP